MNHLISSFSMVCFVFYVCEPLRGLWNFVVWPGVGDTDLALCDGVGSAILVGEQPFIGGGYVHGYFCIFSLFSCPVILEAIAC